jgi:hypothetical protein
MSIKYKVTLNWRNTVLGLNAQNVLYFRDESGTKTVDQIGALIDDNFWGSLTVNGELRNFTSTNVRLDGQTIQQLTPNNPQAGVPYTGQLRSGASGTAVVHPCVGLVFTLKDGSAGRAHRGRIYHYGATVGQTQNSNPTAANIAGTFAQWMANILVRFGPGATTGLRLMLHHGNLIGDSNFTDVMSMRVNPVYGIQRRRNFNVGL